MYICEILIVVKTCVYTLRLRIKQKYLHTQSLQFLIKHGKDLNSFIYLYIYYYPRSKEWKSLSSMFICLIRSYLRHLT